jgi:hypothetical protein
MALYHGVGVCMRFFLCPAVLCRRRSQSHHPPSAPWVTCGISKGFQKYLRTRTGQQGLSTEDCKFSPSYRALNRVYAYKERLPRGLVLNHSNPISLWRSFFNIRFNNNFPSIHKSFEWSAFAAKMALLGVVALCR